MSTEPPPGSGRPRSTADLVVSIALLVLAVPLALVASYAGLFLVMAADGCGIQGECSTLGLTAGVGVATLGPWVGLLALGTWAVVRLVRRRPAWWTALAALLVVPALFGAGFGIVFGSLDV